MECLNCHTGEMITPVDNHPAYYICPNCEAIELRYSPQEYQKVVHEVDYIPVFNEETGEEEYAPQIIAVFGG